MSQNQNLSKRTTSTTAKVPQKAQQKTSGNVHQPKDTDTMVAGFQAESDEYTKAPKKFKPGEGIIEPMPTVG